MTPEVAAAVEEVRLCFSDAIVQAEPDGQGGARIKVCDVMLGEKYMPCTCWCAFVIPFQYPRADVYPHFIDPSVKRKDNQGLGAGFQTTNWEGSPAIQVSRRSNRWDPTVDTAALKLAKVLEWIRSL